MRRGLVTKSGSAVLPDFRLQLRVSKSLTPIMSLRHATPLGIPSYPYQKSGMLGRPGMPQALGALKLTALVSVATHNKRRQKQR
jgi:hypothetical protein